MSDDMDSDCDDVFTDDSKGFNEDSKGSPGPEEDGRSIINRKKRRGIIEKRRRDRINNSLSELRRLVPAAFEKQGSAKLEKAEILQMAVDHLRILHSKGLEVLPFDPVHGLTTDYHGIGFRECASEVARYLVGFEGLDAQDPLRLRLMSHLQCFSAQRDVLQQSSPPPVSPHHAVRSTTSGLWFAVPTPQYHPVLFQRKDPRYRPTLSQSKDFSSTTRTSSSSMSVDSNGGGSSPKGWRPNPSYVISPTFRKSESEGKLQRSPTAMPYRPWGAEVAY